MCETVYSSVIWVDGVILSIARPLAPDAHQWLLESACVIARDRAEIEKAQIDMMCFGTGMTLVTDDGIRHVPFSEWIR